MYGIGFDFGRVTHMKFPFDKEVLTTGDVARICHVAPRTVTKWFDTGKLRGYRIPGSRDRRIPVDQLLAFMRAYEIPLESLDGGICKVLLMDAQVPAEVLSALRDSGRYEVRLAQNGFDAGVVAHQFRPHVIVLDTDMGVSESAGICRNIRQRAELQAAKVIAACSPAGPDQAQLLLAEGFDACLLKPYSARDLVRVVAEATNLAL